MMPGDRGPSTSVWVLEPEKIPKTCTDETPVKGLKEQNSKKNILEVAPVKKYAELKDKLLTLSDQDGSSVTINLLNCTVVSISASNLSSKKWAKRYPIKVESKETLIYKGSKLCFLYFDTAWEKESWCKALRLASCPDNKKWEWYTQLGEDFHNYLTSLCAEYPSFLKPSALIDAIDKDSSPDYTLRTDGSSKVRVFLKKLAKKASKNASEMRQNSTSSLTRGERRISDKSRLSSDASLADGLVRSSTEDKSSSNSLKDMVSGSHEPLLDDKHVDEGTLCWNLLIFRLFFDAKRSAAITDAIKARLQKTLSNMRTPSYIGEVMCTGLDVGNLPPHIQKMRVYPMDLNEVWAMEIDVEYSGGVLFDIETRIEVREPELHNDIMKTSSEPNSHDTVDSDLLEGIEQYRKQLNSPSNSSSQKENDDLGDKTGGLSNLKSARRTSNYVSRWKTILHSLADQVSQVPLSLTIKVASLRGTLRLHIKPPPSDQVWFGFTTMPEIEWNLESSVGERKITNSHVGMLIGNRIKAAIRENLVLPNCESICIPWMLAEKDDWVPRKVAPFIWLNQETTDLAGPDISKPESEGTSVKCGNVNKSKADSAVFIDDEKEKVKTVIHVEQPNMEAVTELPISATRPFGSVASSSRTSDELRTPLLRPDESDADNNSQTELTKSFSSTSISSETVDDNDKSKKGSRRAKMIDFGKRMGDKLEEKRKHLEEKSRHIVEKMRENART